MADNELTQEEVFALAASFPVASARTLLSLARFPPWAVPEAGFGTALEFWSKIAEQLTAGVMPDGRGQILAAARRWYPANKAFAGPAAPAQSAGRVIHVTGGQGFQIGDGNVQYNQYLGDVSRLADAPRGEPTTAAPTARLRVLVIGASPDDPDLPHVRADREAHAIERAARPGRVAVTVVLGAEATDVRQVGTVRPDILHFACHGEADRLVFNDIRGEPDYVKASRVADLLRFYRDTSGVRLRGIVLAACDGERLAPFFAGVAGTVIAHRGKLSDPCGTAFAAQLYTQLNDTTDLAAAAREAAQLTAQYSEGCEPVIDGLIVLPGSG